MRRRITQAVLVELRKRTPGPNSLPVVALIVRRIIDPDPARLGMPPLPTPPNSLEQDALITDALAGFRRDGKMRRLILHSASAALGR